ncbi:hypothetical protein MTP10_40890 [Nonomuraea sp. 3-1Str]|uniref:hypothetical protein n=1 Tax=Nonomuraea sp. 3-1Str TaxID=2929801 RepID=UPI002855B85C|nr:hypothetical protein [Nonomuraea sp. 3-1Str]MDR8415075.1 hypothetical protein [Nonomuraea sp. 3-1Str]
MRAAHPPFPAARALAAELDAGLDAEPESRSKRYPHYEGADELPGLPSELWWRLLRLLITRGEYLHPCAARLAKHLSLEADKRGRLVDIDEVLEKYAATHLLSKRVGWTDLDRLIAAGLVRQARRPAPGIQARYVLAMDLAALPDDLPKTLAAEVRRHIDNPITIAKGGQTKAMLDEGLAECEVVRYGSAVRREPIMTALGCGRLHTSPYTREGLPPPQSQPSQKRQRPRLLPFQGRDFDEERGAALNFVKILAPEWARQRAGQVPSDAEMGELAHLVMLLLRHMPESEARELLTTQVASATDLCGVLRWRIGRTLAQLRRAGRRARQLRVDDDGRRHAAFLAANAERNAANAARRAELVELARRQARRLAGDRVEGELTRLDARTAPHDGAEPQNRLSGPHPLPPGNRSGDAPNAPWRPSGGLCEPEEIFQREVRDRHRLPDQTSGTPENEPDATPSAEAVAADREWLVQMMAARSRS